jgi:hypothetical protein
VARFRRHTFDDIDGFVALMDQHYGARGGTKGNLTLTTYDGLLKVQVAVADLIVFGAELQTAKSLVDECLQEWSAKSGKELRTVVQRAFDVEKEGLINRGRLLALLGYEIEDERWLRAMDAIRDSIKVIGSKRYVNVYRRADAKAPWTRVSIDVAAS